MPAETITWIAADGTEFPFDGSSGFRCLEGPTGRMAPSFDIATRQLVTDGGTRIDNVTVKPRTVTLAVEILADSPPAHRALWRALVASLDPRKGDGRLRFAPPDGNQRQFRARYVQGLEGDDGPAKSTPALTENLVAIQFLVCDAMAEDVADTYYEWTIESGGGSFFPIFPIVLGASTVYAESTLPVLGDVPCWPQWTLRGPGGPWVLTNATMGLTLATATVLDVGETLTIDTRPGDQSTDPKSVRDNTGRSRFTELTAWKFWPLTPGNQRVRIGAAGATVETLVSVVWRPRWETT